MEVGSGSGGRTLPFLLTRSLSTLLKTGSASQKHHEEPLCRVPLIYGRSPRRTVRLGVTVDVPSPDRPLGISCRPVPRVGR